MTWICKGKIFAGSQWFYRKISDVCSFLFLQQSLECAKKQFVQSISSFHFQKKILSKNLQSSALPRRNSISSCVSTSLICDNRTNIFFSCDWRIPNHQVTNLFTELVLMQIIPSMPSPLILNTCNIKHLLNDPNDVENPYIRYGF